MSMPPITMSKLDFSELLQKADNRKTRAVSYIINEIRNKGHAICNTIDLDQKDKDFLSKQIGEPLSFEQGENGVVKISTTYEFPSVVTFQEKYLLKQKMRHDEGIRILEKKYLPRMKKSIAKWFSRTEDLTYHEYFQMDEASWIFPTWNDYVETKV